jgi:hypothetical protein
MKQSYESQIQQLKNELKQVQTLSNSKVAATAQRVAIPAMPNQQVI